MKYVFNVFTQRFDLVNTDSSDRSALHMSAVTGEDINGGDVVVAIGGLVYKMDILNNAHYERVRGVANQAVLAGEMLDIVMEGLCNQMGGLTEGGLYYAVSPAGSISTSSPTLGISQVIGQAINSTTIMVRIRKSYIKI